MKRAILWLLFYGLTTPFSVKADLLLTVAVDESKLRYQVRINAGTNKVDYDASALVPASPSLCPRGVVAYLISANGQYLGCENPEQGYSSASLSSTLVRSRDYKPIRKGSEYASEYQRISDVLRGVETCITPSQVDRIAKVRLGFDILLRVNGV